MTAPMSDTLAAGHELVRPIPAPDSVRDVAAPNLTFGRMHGVPVEAGMHARSGWLAEALYRGFEMTAALVGLIVCLPLMLIEAILIRLDSPGPVLFFQKRVAGSERRRGRDLVRRDDLIPPPGGWEPDRFYYVPKLFTFVKFRTMHADARQRFPELYAYRYSRQDFLATKFKNDNDPRVTRVGTILRRLTLDELPNLWCVLVGDMRLVGPRPELPEIPQYYSPAEMYKFACKPGITGLAQINGRGLLNWGETLAWDLEYVRTRTITMDFKITAMTLWYVIVQRGAF